MSADHRKTIAQHIAEVGYRHSRWDVFSDFVEMSAIGISNAVDVTKRAEREARYSAIAKRYEADEIRLFPRMLSQLVNALGEGFDDVLGRLFHDLELHSKWHGQFFTPYDLARLLAETTLGDRDEVERTIADQGFISVLEPACGAGAMVIAFAETLKERGVNYQTALHVTAVDVDPKCVHMAYVQFSLLGIPAVVVHGNSLTLEEQSHWRTPLHVLGNWEWRLRRSEEASEPDVILPAQSGPQGDLFARAVA